MLIELVHRFPGPDPSYYLGWRIIHAYEALTKNSFDMRHVLPQTLQSAATTIQLLVQLSVLRSNVVKDSSNLFTVNIVALMCLYFLEDFLHHCSVHEPFGAGTLAGRMHGCGGACYVCRGKDLFHRTKKYLVGALE